MYWASGKKNACQEAGRKEGSGDGKEYFTSQKNDNTINETVDITYQFSLRFKVLILYWLSDAFAFC
jgi:hypothetical protein